MFGDSISIFTRDKRQTKEYIDSLNTEVLWFVKYIARFIKSISNCVYLRTCLLTICKINIANIIT